MYFQIKLTIELVIILKILILYIIWFHWNKASLMSEVSLGLDKRIVIHSIIEWLLSLYVIMDILYAREDAYIDSFFFCQKNRFKLS